MFDSKQDTVSPANEDKQRGQWLQYLYRLQPTTTAFVLTPSLPSMHERHLHKPFPPFLPFPNKPYGFCGR